MLAVSGAYSDSRVYMSLEGVLKAAAESNEMSSDDNFPRGLTRLISSCHVLDVLSLTTGRAVTLSIIVLNVL